MRLTLQTRLLLLVAGTATGLASVLLLSIAVLAKREINASVRNDVRATGGVLGRFIQDRSVTLKQQCVLLTKQPVLKAVIGTDNPATVLYTARGYRDQIHADIVVVTDRDGRVLGATDGTPPRTDVSRESGVQAALDERPGVGVVARQGRLMLADTEPVKIGQYVVGTFTAYRAIDPGLARDLRNALGSDVAFTYRGQVVGASLSLPARLPTPQGTPRLITLGGVRYYALYAPLPGTQPGDGMGFVTLHAYNQAMAFFQRLQAGLVVVTLVTLLLALAGGTFLARGLTRPLDGVVQAARLLQAGEWPERFDVSRHDEIGLLQTVFNEMTTAMRSSQERLLALIDTDPLTGLDNHRRFRERLAQEAKRCEASGEALSLLLIDLDHFGQYNQLYGHAAGDEALQEVAETLRACLPDVAIAARFGGEEFAVLLPQRALEGAEQLAERIRAVVCEAACRPGSERRLTLSVGCAEFGTNTKEGEGLVFAAELAVSRAKQLGRDRVCRFDSVPGADHLADPYQLHKFWKDESLATIQALAAAVDAKDPYTQGHSKRVALYAAEFALALGLPDGEVDQIHITGTLHDVGKIGVPDAVLQKPGRLTDDERVIIETHPALGEVIVRKAPALSYTLPGVRHHHERWDGKGYPDGLAGEAIPRIGRLLALADTFDAMTSDRPYRKGLSWTTALAEIEKGAGTQFDPALSPVFVAMMRRLDAEKGEAFAAAA